MIVTEINQVSLSDIIATNAVDYTDVYDAGTTYPVGGLRGFAGIVYSSLQASNVGHQPDTSPTWWKQADFDLTFDYPKDVLTIDAGYIYISMQTPNIGKAPADNPAYWSKVEAANRYAMFDGESNTVTSRAENLTVSFNSKFVNSITLIKMRAKTGNIKVKKGALVIFDKTYDFANHSVIQTIEEYCFAERQLRKALSELNVPVAGSVIVEITLDYPGDVVELGVCAVGKKLDVGPELTGLTLAPIDYSQVTKDKDGLIHIDYEFTVNEFQTQAIFKIDRWDYIAEKLLAILGRPCIVIGGDGQKDSLILYARIKYRMLWKHQRDCEISIDVTGLI
ncbi:hypothetical protein [Undibacterium macrobrachii]|uniref:Uncharacterized protein n=1 Tax=Undibacterium macrobrachii TaxID=1119058 RepID=A0ABQ2X6D2_9BURK|nr:hypothetical protein [Undibacterium macrobrachii]GGX01406.1 hypothetical protein GCM10011282_04160 [Undibacterium macrobrachii]